MVSPDGDVQNRVIFTAQDFNQSELAEASNRLNAHYAGLSLEAVRERSAGQVPLRTGSFYRHLSVLLDAGLVAEATTRPPEDDPRRGTYYRITARGQRVLVAERRRLAALDAAIDGLQQSPRRGPA